SLLDRQVDVVDGDELAVELDEPARADRELIAHGATCATSFDRTRSSIRVWTAAANTATPAKPAWLPDRHRKRRLIRGRAPQPPPLQAAPSRRGRRRPRRASTSARFRAASRVRGR